MSPHPPGREALVARVRAWIDASLTGAHAEPFERIVLAVHAWQHQHTPVLRALRDAPATTVEDLPRLSVELFRHLDVGTVPYDATDIAVFRTSGTSVGRRGVHRTWDTTVYDHSATAWAHRCLPEDVGDVVALLPPPLEAPDSSLSHMIATLADPERLTWHLLDGALDLEGLEERLTETDRPLFVATTAFSLAAWLAQGAPALPEGSTVMVTGGFKGHRAAVAPEDLYATARSTLQPAHLVTEYGMTELSSQLWGRPGAPYVPPPWLRVLAVDPVDGRPLPPGTPGQLAFLDLANVDSVVGIETFDEGVVHDDGTVTLLGRLSGSAARGCSLTAERALA